MKSADLEQIHLTLEIIGNQAIELVNEKLTLTGTEKS